MLEFHLSSKAKLDIENIWFYTYQNWSESQADFYFELLINEIQSICFDPKKGKSIDEIFIGLKFSKIKSHLVFYTIQSDRITVLRILHKSMILDSKFEYSF
jgi:toxin ParE1/3/4